MIQKQEQKCYPGNICYSHRISDLSLIIGHRRMYGSLDNLRRGCHKKLSRHRESLELVMIQLKFS
jgi:hypothetical protein